MRRTRLTGKQADLFPNWRHHCFATNRTGPVLVADTDHRDHATIELAIPDLIDQALCHFPSGRMHANSVLPSLLAATRTGLTPAGDEELMLVAATR